jgi:type IV pilus assembly protein PilC
VPQIDLHKFKTIPAPSKEKRGESILSRYLNQDIKVFTKRLSDKKKERFYSELFILFSAGVDIKSSLDLICEQQTKQFDKNLIRNISDYVVKGDNLSDALRVSGQFSPYEYYSLKIGEESGRQQEILEELVKFYDGKVKQRRQFLSAVSYPAIIVFTAAGAIFFMLNFVVPMFADVFKRFNADLPYITKLVIAASSIVGRYFWLFLLLTLVLGLILYFQRKEEWLRKGSSGLLLQVPVLGKIFRKIYLARFCHSMNLLISSQTQLTTAVDLIKKMISFYPIESTMENVKRDLMNGIQLHKSLSKFSIFDKRMISLIKVGEEVNELEKIFERLSINYSSEVEYETKLLSSLIEPAIIIILGFFVGIILIAMYLPLFKLGTSIH